MPESSVTVIRVLIGEIAMSRHPRVLEAILGSCIGISMFDRQEGVGGMAHVLLPNSGDKTPGSLPGKYADHAVPILYRGLIEHGARGDRIKAKMAGGARMFLGATQAPDIGRSNVEAVRKALALFSIPVLGEDVGGSVGRKVVLSLSDWTLMVEDFHKRRASL